MPALIVRRSAVGPSVPSFIQQQSFYVGPGDIVSGWSAWGGLRAYSQATTGRNAVRLRRSSDNAEQDFITLYNGQLDYASITSFKGADNLFVTKLYDQTGNGLDLAQSTTANQPPFRLNDLNGQATMGDGSSDVLLSINNVTLSWPYELYTFTVCVSLSGLGNFPLTMFDTSLSKFYGLECADNTNPMAIAVYNGTSSESCITVPIATVGSWFFFIGVINGGVFDNPTASFADMNGTDYNDGTQVNNSVGNGPSSVSGFPLSFGTAQGNTHFKRTEFGWYQGSLLGASVHKALSDNVRYFYGVA